MPFRVEIAISLIRTMILQDFFNVHASRLKYQLCNNLKYSDYLIILSRE
jgi:hypothetical protein